MKRSWGFLDEGESQSLPVWEDIEEAASLDGGACASSVQGSEVGGL